MKFALAQEEWHDVLQESDADIAYEHFIHKLLSYYNQYILLVKTKTSKKNKQPWITKGIKKSISTRNKLYKEALRSNCNQKT